MIFILNVYYTWSSLNEDSSLLLLLELGMCRLILSVFLFWFFVFFGYLSTALFLLFFRFLSSFACAYIALSFEKNEVSVVWSNIPSGSGSTSNSSMSKPKSLSVFTISNIFFSPSPFYNI